nr:hypothetical protein Q903MT_gene1925 [Picea sitchensis]
MVLCFLFILSRVDQDLTGFTFQDWGYLSVSYLPELFEGITFQDQTNLRGRNRRMTHNKYFAY